MERELPRFDIEGTTFIVDVAEGMLVEEDNPKNTIALDDMIKEDGYHIFKYNTVLKTLVDYDSPDHPDVDIIKMSPAAMWDPIGWATRHAKDVIQRIDGDKLKFEIDQNALATRLSGKQPTIDIAGHLFYVNLNADRLEPRGDFSTLGIPISETIRKNSFDDQDVFSFPYDPKSHTAAEIDYENVLSVPKDLLLVEVPKPARLDPVGYARQGGLPLEVALKAHPVISHHVAKIIPWEKSYLMFLIMENKKMKSVPRDQQGNEQIKNTVKHPPRLKKAWKKALN